MPSSNNVKMSRDFVATSTITIASLNARVLSDAGAGIPPDLHRAASLQRRAAQRPRVLQQDQPRQPQLLRHRSLRPGRLQVRVPVILQSLSVKQ